MDVQRAKARACEAVDARAAALDELALEIHAQPELAFEERAASQALASYAAREGARVECGIAGLDTAFIAEHGTGGPVVAVLAELDALPGIGHACGHNLIGTAALGAFLAVRDALPRGRIRLLGCPAEERGNGKIALIRAGLFRDVDAALMFHPGDRDEVDPLMIGMVDLDVEFRGRAAHAAAAPQEGINALDGLLLGWTALSSLRQLVRSDTRIHGVIVDGGQAANVIPERAAARLLVRSPDNAYLAEVRRRVLACFEGAAQATGCELRHAWGEACETVVNNAALGAAFAANARALGRDPQPRDARGMRGSTDMGNVTSVVPGVHPFLAICDGTPLHSLAFARAAATPRALETMRVAAKALAMTALDALSDAALLRRAKEELDAGRR